MDPQQLRIIYYPEPEDTVILNIERMREPTGLNNFYANCSYCNVNPCYACVLKRNIGLPPIKEEEFCEGCRCPTDSLAKCLKCDRRICIDCAGGLKGDVINCFNCQVDSWTE